MRILLFIITLLFPVSAKAGSSIEWTPFLQQSSLYYSSDRVTAGGFGLGAGVRFNRGKHLVAQADINAFWANGNTVATKCALGYQRDGRWAPAIFGTLGLLWGQRTEVLSTMGERPISPVWIVGFRGVPLCFNGKNGSISVVEMGYGIGPDNGMNLELTIMRADFHW